MARNLRTTNPESRNLIASALVIAAVLCGCASAADDTSVQDTQALSELSVNGHALTAGEETWMRHVATEVVPHLAGTRDERLTVAARAAWWSLKEGDFGAKNPPRYSNCNSESGDHTIGPLETCEARRAWQVGLAGVQVPGHSVSDLEALANELYPDETADQVLADAAEEAGFDRGSTTSNAIVASQGSLRASWLLRRSAIGFTVVESSEVVPECIEASRGFCYGAGWDETKRYAPTKSAAMGSIEDIKTILAQLAP